MRGEEVDEERTDLGEAGGLCELSFMNCCRWRCSSARPAGREREGAHELQSQVPHARNNHTCWPMQGDLSLELVYPDADRAGPRVLLLLHQHLYREWVWI